MEGIITLILLFCYIGITWQGWHLRKELAKTVYWKSLPKGVAMFGYCLPVLVFLILNLEKIGFLRFLLSILLVVLFIYSVIEENSNFKKKPLEGFPSIMPDDMRKKVTTFHALTPLLTIFVLVFIGVVIDSLFNISDYIKGSRKKR